MDIQRVFKVILEHKTQLVRRKQRTANIKYCCNWGWTEVQSSAVHIQALVSVDGILPVISSKLQLLFINLASVPGRQLVNSPTAAILDRCVPFKLTAYKP